MYKAPSFGLGMKKDLRESIESVYNINNSINEEEQLIISLFEEFLEENFHVEMLTEEDLDYVFENEFPQWLEEVVETGSDRADAITGNNNSSSKSYVNHWKDLKSKKRQAKRNAEAKSPPNDITPPSTSPPNDITPPSKTGSGPDRSMEGIRFQRSKTPPTGSGPDRSMEGIAFQRSKTPPTGSGPTPKTTSPTANKPRKQVRRSAPKPQSFGALLRKVGGNAPATSDTAAGRRKIKLLDARAKARTAARDAIVRKTGRGQLSWAKKAFNPDGN